MKTPVVGFFLVAAMAVAAPSGPLPPAITHALAGVDVPLPNACVPKATAFLCRYITENPGEMGELVFLELSRAKVGTDPVRAAFGQDDLFREMPRNREKAGHALAAFSHAGTIWLYDHELGVRATTIPERRYESRRSKPAIGRIYDAWVQDTLRRKKQERIRFTGTGAVRDSKMQVLLVCRMLSDRLKPLIVELSGGEEYACVWGFLEYVWAYSPKRGTSCIAVDRKKSDHDLAADVLARAGIHETFVLHVPVRFELDRLLIAALDKSPGDETFPNRP